MDNYTIEERSTFGKSYLSIDMSDLGLIEYVQKKLSELKCVWKVNITNGKRSHLTVYIYSSEDFKDASNSIRGFMKKLVPPKDYRDAEVEHSINSVTDSSVDLKPEAMNNVDTYSQLDEIPADRLVVFISYAWDDDDHREWVRKFSDKLRSKYGIYTLLDQYNRAGQDMVDFMTKGIKRASKVLVIGSPKYKEKLESGDPCGVSFEDQIINIEIYRGDKSKFIPILARGTFESSFTEIMNARFGFDLSTPEKYNKGIERLAADICGKPVNCPPTLGPISDPERTIVETAFTITQPTDARRTVLTSDPYKGDTWLKKLIESFSFNLMDKYFMDMPNRCDMKVIISYDMWKAGIGSTTFKIINSDTGSVLMDFFKLWSEVTEYGSVYYSPSVKGDCYMFYGHTEDLCCDSEADDAFQLISDKLPILFNNYKTMAKHIKECYPEIDIEATSIEFEKSI